MPIVQDEQTAEIRSVDVLWFENNSREAWEKHIKPLSPFASYLELGVFSGSSLLWAAENLLQDHGCAEGVDKWEPYRRGEEADSLARNAKYTARAMASEFNSRNEGCGKKIVLHEADSCEFMCSLAYEAEKNYDCVFVDGDHHAPEALTDICLAWNLLYKGGILIIDDVDLQRGRRISSGPLSGEAADAFLTCFGGRLTVLYRTRKQLAVRKDR